MRMTAQLVVLLLTATLCVAQETTIADAKRDLSRAKDELEKVVVFRAEEEGGGAFLNSEYKTLQHRQHLERKAEKKGVSAEAAGQFDMANRLEKYREQIKPEAFEMLVAYVGFVKVYREYEAVIKADEAVAAKVGEIIDELDTLIGRHGRALRIDSLKLLYEEEPAGKVGTFVLRGAGETVRIDGKDAEVLKLRTLKGQSLLIMKAGAKKRTGFMVAEIIGKDTYKTDDGKEIRGILLQAY